MAFLQNIKALGYDLSEEDVKREEESMEVARTQALEAWEQIRDNGFSYDMNGFEHLRSCTQIATEGAIRGNCRYHTDCFLLPL